jgi:sigma-B regulation protein RsbU (phosphoserine phosphatase)
MSEGTYQKKECLVGERNTLYIFSDGVYEVEKSDGSMWRFQEFADFMSNVKSSTVVSFHYGNLKNSKHSDLTTCEK